MKLPCLREDGLAIFSTTAAQRLNLGEELFLQTHFPMRLKRFDSTGTTPEITENDIIDALLNVQGVGSGNRVTLLYGAAGAGKSELMAWLELQLKQRTERPIFRVARTDLNIFRIIEQFKYWLTGAFFDDITHQRWAEMRQKPRTFTKLLTLKSLEAMLTSDSHINALYYRLVDKIEPYITQLLELDTYTPQLELLPRDVFDDIKSQTVLPIPIDYEQFRQHLLDEFRQQLLGGVDISATLQAISENLARQNQRPILLIDDLVQSINIFATDFLDYFITLDKGEWDVVIGLTPSSFETDRHHRDILERITYLDTFDDRVEKLWLSDERGEKSYFVTEANCVEFAFQYLQAFRSINHLQCKQCPAVARCAALASHNSPILAPFNDATIIRIFRSLPNNKGKIRYFLKYLRDMLHMLIQGHTVEQVFENFKSDIAVEASASEIGAIVMWYAPIDVQSGEFKLSNDLKSFFELSPHNAIVQIRELGVSQLAHQPQAQPDYAIDPAQSMINQWLNQQPVNRHLLDSLRKGVAQWLKNMYPVEYFYRQGIAQPNAILCYKQVEMATNPPIAIEGVDDFEGIILSRSIGHMAFHFYEYAIASQRQAHQLESILQNDARTVNLLWDAIAFQQTHWHRLEQLLQAPLDEFAFAVFVVLLLANGIPDAPVPPLAPYIMEAIREAYDKMLVRTQVHRLHTSRNAQMSQEVFDDFFRLRKNIYDGFRLQELGHQHTLSSLLTLVKAIRCDSIPDTYRLRDVRLADFIQQLQAIIAVYDEIEQQSSWVIAKAASPQVQKTILHLQKGETLAISDISVGLLDTIRIETPEIYAQISLSLRIDSLLNRRVDT